MTDDTTLRRLMMLITSCEELVVGDFLYKASNNAHLALKKGATRKFSTSNFLGAIDHYVYAGDITLHIASAAYRVEIARELIDLGANVRAQNRQGATPLHYAADGNPASSRWSPQTQSATISLLIALGADPHAIDKGGVTPLHCAIRNRCGTAVRALLDGGADARRLTRHGSTSIALAKLSTVRSGSGSPAAKFQQAEILSMLGC